MTTTGPRHLIAVLSAANFVIGMGAFVLIGMLTPVGDDLGLSPARTGWTMTTYALAYAVLSPLLVSFTGRIGRRRVLTAAFAIFCLSNLLSALAPSELTLHLARVLAATGAGILTPVAAPIVLALNAAAIYVGAAIGSAIGSLVISNFGLSGLGIAAGCLAGLSVCHILWSERLNRAMSRA